MLKAWYVFQDITDVHFDNMGTFFVYEQPLYFNNRLQTNDKPIFVSIFAKAGITKLKHLTLEVISKFLSPKAIAEIVHEYDHISMDAILSNFNTVMSSIPADYKKVVLKNVHTNCRTESKPYVIYKDEKGTNVQLYPTTTRDIYFCFIIHCFKYPKSTDYWKDMFPNVVLKSVFSSMYVPCYPSDIVDIHYRIVHNSIFTMAKLTKIGQVDSEVCPVCEVDTETLQHLFLDCVQLSEFIEYIDSLIETLFSEADQAYLTDMSTRQLILLGYTRKIKNTNTFFINFLLGFVRFCIFKRRNLVINKMSNIDIKKFFCYTFKKYFEYVKYYYQMKKKYALFVKYIVKNNNLVEENVDFTTNANVLSSYSLTL